ncbi:hypothetical protein T439DRAFT_357906 [Meredithblackwellia eburnea MCA 4105]
MSTSASALMNRRVRLSSIPAHGNFSKWICNGYLPCPLDLFRIDGLPDKCENKGGESWLACSQPGVGKHVDAHQELNSIQIWHDVKQASIATGKRCASPGAAQVRERRVENYSFTTKNQAQVELERNHIKLQAPQRDLILILDTMTLASWNRLGNTYSRNMPSHNVHLKPKFHLASFWVLFPSISMSRSAMACGFGKNGTPPENLPSDSFHGSTMANHLNESHGDLLNNNVGMSIYVALIATVDLCQLGNPPLRDHNDNTASSWLPQDLRPHQAPPDHPGSDEATFRAPDYLPDDDSYKAIGHRRKHRRTRMVSFDNLSDLELD